MLPLMNKMLSEEPRHLTYRPKALMKNYAIISLSLFLSVSCFLNSCLPRVVEPKTQRSFVDSHKSSAGESVWWAWPQLFARYIDLKCCKFFGPTLVASSWAGEVFPSTPSISPSRPTLGLEVYEFYLNLLSFSAFLLSFFYYNHCFWP